MKIIPIPLILVTLSAPVFAVQQKAIAPAKLQKATAPQHAGSYHPTTGFTKSNRSVRVGHRPILNNSALSNYYTIPGTDQEWVDDYYLQNLSADQTEQVNGLEFVYCSSNMNPNGVQATMTLYDESIYCAGPINWPVSACSYAVSGLPGGNNGALACWIVLVDLWGVECNLTTENFGTKLTGWGQMWDNNDSGPWISQGDPGSTDYFTWWDTTVPNINAFQGCYWWGAPPPSNFYIKLFGGPVDTNRYWAEDIGGTSTGIDNGLLDVDNQVKVGNTVTFQLTDPNGIGYDTMQLVHARAASSWAIPYMGGNVLIEPATMIQRPPGPTSQSYVVPPVSGDYYTQAAGISGGLIVGLSNGLRHQDL